MWRRKQGEVCNSLLPDACCLHICVNSLLSSVYFTTSFGGDISEILNEYYVIFFKLYIIF